MGFLKSVAPALSFIPGWGPMAAAGASLIGGAFGGDPSGGQSQAGDVGNFYQNALAQIPQITANQIGQEKQALQSSFGDQDKELAAKEAAMGITNSGAAKADFSDLAGRQAGALASAISPLYQQELGIYGGILGAKPGAQTGAYGNALQNYYNSQPGLGQLIGSFMPGQSSNSNPYSYNGVPATYDNSPSDPYGGGWGTAEFNP